MEIVTHIKFGSEKQRVISFGSWRYLVYLISKKEDSGAMVEFSVLMAKYFGVPPSRVIYKGKRGEVYVFKVE